MQRKSSAARARRGAQLLAPRQSPIMHIKLFFLYWYMIMSSSNAIQPYTRFPLPIPSVKGDSDQISNHGDDDDFLFLYWNDFHTKAQIELPFQVTFPVPESSSSLIQSETSSSGPTYGPIAENTYRRLNFFVHIPPIYYLNKTQRRKSNQEYSSQLVCRNDETPGGFMASFSAQSTLMGYTYPTNTLFTASENSNIPPPPPSSWIKRKNIGYSTQRFSLGYMKKLVQPSTDRKRTIDNYCGTLLSWVHWDLSKSQGSKIFYSLSHTSPSRLWITDLELTNPLPSILNLIHKHSSSPYSATSIISSTKPFLCAIQSTHPIIHHKLYTFFQGYVMVDPRTNNTTTTRWIPYYYFNIGFSTTHPSIQQHPSSVLFQSNTNKITSLSSRFLPSIQLYLQLHDDSEMDGSSDNHRIIPPFRPTCKVQMKKTFQLPSFKAHDMGPSVAAPKEPSDFYSLDVQLQISPPSTTRGWLDISTYFSKSIPCFNRTHSMNESSSPYETLKHGGFVLTWGIQSICKQSIHWFLRWDHEDLSLHIPLKFNYSWNPTNSTFTTNLFGLTDSNLQFSIVLIESIYLYFFSHCIQSVLNYYKEKRTSGHDVPSIEKEIKYYSYFHPPMKSYRDAISQMDSMKSRADIIHVKEEECNGLVIDKAWYYVDGCCCSHNLNRKPEEIISAGPCFIDVTTPLQFWVQESKLSLAPGTKSNLLGFCSLSPWYCPTCRKKQKEGTPFSKRSMRPSRLNVKYFIYGLYEWLINDSRSTFNPKDMESIDDMKPTILLCIRYYFNGKLLENTFQDEAEVYLPVSF